MAVQQCKSGTHAACVTSPVGQALSDHSPSGAHVLSVNDRTVYGHMWGCDRCPPVNDRWYCSPVATQRVLLMSMTTAGRADAVVLFCSAVRCSAVQCDAMPHGPCFTACLPATAAVGHTQLADTCVIQLCMHCPHSPKKQATLTPSQTTSLQVLLPSHLSSAGPM
jgi:hypothetical protein